MTISETIKVLENRIEANEFAADDARYINALIDAYEAGVTASEFAPSVEQYEQAKADRDMYRDRAQKLERDLREVIEKLQAETQKRQYREQQLGAVALIIGK